MFSTPSMSLHGSGVVMDDCLGSRNQCYYMVVDGCTCHVGMWWVDALAQGINVTAW